MSPSIVELVLKLQEQILQDQEAHQILYNKMRQLFLGGLKHKCRGTGVEAEDIFQESFCRATRGIKSLRKPDRFLKRFKLILHNEFVAGLKKADSVQKREPYYSPDPTASILRDEVIALLKGLSSQMEIKIFLYRIDGGYTVKETAESFSISNGRVSQICKEVNSKIGAFVARASDLPKGQAMPVEPKAYFPDPGVRDQWHTEDESKPHFGKAALSKLRARIEELAQSLGKPGTSTSIASLRRQLSDSYQSTCDKPGTRSLAIIISSIQDYFSGHWAEMRPHDLNQLCLLLEELESEAELSTDKTLDAFRRIAALSPSGIDFPHKSQMKEDWDQTELPAGW